MNLLHWFYVQPMYTAVMEITGVFFLWCALMLILSPKAKKILSVPLLIISVLGILTITILKRDTGDYQIFTTPFISFSIAKYNPEIYRGMLMNILLFVPFGLSLPFCLSDKVKHKYILSIIIGLLFTALIETTQFFSKLGRFETDDIIMNFLGAAIGALSYVIVKKLLDFNSRHRNRAKL